MWRTGFERAYGPIIRRLCDDDDDHDIFKVPFVIFKFFPKCDSDSSSLSVPLVTERFT